MNNNNNKIIFSLALLIIMSCNSKQEYSIETINKLSPTYVITSESILNELKKIDYNVNFDDSADIFILYVEKNTNKNYTISITKTELFFFRKFKSDYYFKTLKGYANYNDQKVLLYGDLENHLFEKTSGNLKDIIYYQKSADKLEEPIIYEPTFIDFIVK